MSKVTVYTMDYCPYCVAAKNLLKQHNIPFDEIKFAEDDDASWDMLEKKSGMKTMPQIFNGDELIGGYNELSALNRSNGLDHLKK
ncbi:MAG: glutaredoxin 3 [Xanthomonadaceae bacterium]|nr:glutaredoxin 3 [Xanthomonadaceae bacterium]